MAIKVLDMASSKTLQWAEQQVQEAYETWQQMVFYDFPQHQILAMQNELEERIGIANRIKKIYERLNRRGNKKHS